MSDRFSMTNDMLSRASSPPPSLVGSAPERIKTKAQQKKDRKAKKATETSEAGASNVVVTTPVVEEVAPVLGRQRKVKKIAPATGIDSSKEEKVKAKDKENLKADESVRDAGEMSEDVAKAKNTASANNTKDSKHITQHIPETKKKDSAKIDSKPSRASTPSVKEQSKPSLVEEPRPSKTPYTHLDLYTESAKHKHDPTRFRKLLNEHVSSITQLFASLLDSKEIDPTSALFGNQPSLNSAAFKLPPDSRKGADYLDANGYTDSNPFGQIYLGLKEKKALWNGESFGVADEREGRQGDLLRRALITGGGVVYRHLSREQEDRVMELEARKEQYAAEWGIVGGIGIMDKLGKLEDDDYTNIEGGIDELIRHGDRHGIGWVMGQQREDWDDADAEDDDGDQFDDGYDDEDDKTDDLGLGLDPTVGGWEVAAARGVMPRALTPNVKQASTTKAQPVSAKVNLRAMDNSELQKRIKETLQEMEATKKEMDKMDKLVMKKVKEVARWREGVAALRG
jgi:CCR4-NOT transcription complex subunit 4